VDKGGIFYVKLKPEDIPELVEEQIINNRLFERLLFKDPWKKKKVAVIDKEKCVKCMSSFDKCRFDSIF
jgi:NAD-dependent dihydropyrimidine dehydrogenase PreA subunit